MTKPVRTALGAGVFIVSTAGVGFAQPDARVEAAEPAVAAQPAASVQAEPTSATPAPAVAPPAPALEAPTPAAPASEPSAAAAPTERPTAGFDKDFFLQNPTGPDRLELHAYMQPRYTFQSSEQTDEGHHTTLDNFQIAEARIILMGVLLDPRLGYKFDLEMGKGNVHLKDAWANWAFVAKAFELRVGQFKKPFDRAELTSSTKRDFIEKPLTSKGFQAGYDIGAMVHNGTSGALEYALGLFNGTGQKPWFEGELTNGAVSGTNTPATNAVTGQVDDTSVASSSEFTNVPTRFEPELVLRVGYNHGKLAGYEDADLAGGPLRYGVAASFATDFTTDDVPDGDLRGEVDVAAKVEGLSAQAAFFVSSLQKDGGSYTDQFQNRVGGYAQAGYVIAQHVEPILRYSAVSAKKKENADSQLTQLAAVGVNAYFFGQYLKWQNDLQVGFDSSTGELAFHTYTVLSQMQFMF